MWLCFHMYIFHLCGTVYDDQNPTKFKFYIASCIYEKVLWNTYKEEEAKKQHPTLYKLI